MNKPLQDSLVNLTKANTSLHVAILTIPRNGVILSAIVKNLEFIFELSFKAMKRLLRYHGIPIANPR